MKTARMLCSFSCLNNLNFKRTFCWLYLNLIAGKSMSSTTEKDWWQEVMKFFKVFYNKSIFLPKKVMQYTLQLSSLDIYTVLKRKFFLLPKMYDLKLKHAMFAWKLLSQLDSKKATSVLISSFLILSDSDLSLV